MQSKSHWDHIYSTKAAESVGWFKEHAGQSLNMIRGTGISLSAPIIDVGGGASRLVDGLLAAGYANLTVLDLAAAALAAAKARLGAASEAVQWLEADITSATLPANAYALWHDRAVFHFLTSADDRQAYVATVLRALKPGGHVIVATFAEDGPSQCSGLPVVRYSATQLHAAFGASFTLLQHAKEEHRTPSGTLQQFVYCHFQKSSS